MPAELSLGKAVVKTEGTCSGPDEQLLITLYRIVMSQILYTCSHTLLDLSSLKTLVAFRTVSKVILGPIYYILSKLRALFFPGPDLKAILLEHPTLNFPSANFVPFYWYQYATDSPWHLTCVDTTMLALVELVD
jgi:hypothetical protein